MISRNNKLLLNHWTNQNQVSNTMCHNKIELLKSWKTVQLCAKFIA